MGIELIVGGIGALAGIGSGVMGLNQANEAQEANSKAQKASEELMEEAGRKAEVEFMQTLNVPLDAYNQQYKNQLQSQQQSLQALQEGDSRNLAAGVGAVGAAATTAQENTRIAQGKELFSLRKMQAEEQQSINEDLKDMNVGAAADQQQMARDYSEQANAATRSAVAGFGTAASSVASAMPLYFESASDKTAAEIAKSLDPNQLKGKEIANPAFKEEYYKKVSEPKITGANGVEIDNPDYDPELAKLYGPKIIGKALTQQSIVDRLTQQFSRKQLKEKKKANVYDKNFYDMLYPY